MYEILAPYYDELFPASTASIGFLIQFLPDGLDALDIACGTGSHAIGLADRSVRVYGIDLDEQMIASAQQKAGNRTATFLVGDMLDLAGSFGTEEKFGLIYCLGNSIIHLGDRESIRHCIETMTTLLISGGSIVVQIINFESIVEGRFPDLSTLRSDDAAIEFERRYETHPDPELIWFCTKLISHDRSYEHKTPLVPLRKHELDEMFLGAGLSIRKSAGGFDGSDWRRDSFVTLTVAGK